jgi:acyl transferase domain-containing protein
MTNTSIYDSTYDSTIALVGMAGRFPGAPDVETFWHNLTAGISSIRSFSDEELLAAGIPPALLAQSNYVKVGAPVEDIDLFDASFFGLTPREAETMDPQHRLLLECCWQALEQAGYDPFTYAGLVGVFAGSAFSSYLYRNLAPRQELLASIGQLQVDAGNERDSLSSMISYKLNLRGPAIAVQTFCSTSLVAVHLACQSLLNYECDVALAGGVSLQVPNHQGYLYEHGGILSPDGQCRTFDAQAQGSVFGSGIGVVTLKRFSEALADGDTIYALLRGSSMNNDGSLRVSYTAPSPDGQARVILGALSFAQISADTLSYVEAHGTATPLGDSVELAALRKAFAAHTTREHFCALGSVKPNVGHLDRAAGVTGLIKTALSLYHRQIPPSLQFEQPHPDSHLEHSPFYVSTQLQDWPAGPTPRRAGVSSFGLGGTNVHVILEEPPIPAPSAEPERWQLLPLSARSEAALQQMRLRLAEHLRAHPELSLADVATTLQLGRSTFPYRNVLVSQQIAEAAEALESNNPRAVFSMHQEHRERTTAFLFPGVGEQYPGLTGELYRQEAVFREAVDRCSELLKPYLGEDLRTILYADQSRASKNGAGQTQIDLRGMLGRNGTRSTEASAATLKQTSIAQPAVFVIEYALAQLFMHWGIRPNALMGYSLGEYVAACISGVLSLPDALKLVARRAQLIQATAAGAMIAVALSEESVEQYLDDQVSLAAINGPSTCVLAGPVESIELIEQQLTELGTIVRRVETTHAFHSTMLTEVQEPLKALLGEIALHAPTIPYISNVTGTWITAEQATSPAYWAEQMCQPVRCASGLRLLLQETSHVLLEIGPGQSLSAFARQHPACDKDRLSLVLSTLPALYDRQSESASVLNTLGKLWLAGVEPGWTALHAGEQRYRIPLPTYPFERQRFWLDELADWQQRVLTAQPRTGKLPDRADWFALPTWEQAPLAPDRVTRDAESASPWLIFLDPYHPGRQVAQRLQQAGHRCVLVSAGSQFQKQDEWNYTIRPAEAADYQALCKALTASDLMPRTVLHCWSLTASEAELSGPAGFQTQQENGLYSLLFLAQAISAQFYQETVRVIVLANHLHAVTGQETIYPEKTTLLAACRVIPQELPNLRYRCVDLALDGPNLTLTPRQLAQIVDECLSSSPDPAIAYRGTQRWRQSYQPAKLSAPDEDKSPFRQQGVYLITGGLGYVGLVLADYLARTYQARLVLTSRSTLPPRAEWSAWLAEHAEDERMSRQIRQVQALETAGAEVLVLQADMAEHAQVQGVIAQTLQTFGTLHGVIHAAGITTEDGFGVIQDSGPAQCILQAGPKVYGLYALEEALSGLELDFCLLFSSISAILGGLGFLAYAAANLFMDAYTSQHNQTAERPWLCVNWDTWYRESMQDERLTTIAEYVMQPEEGIDAVRRVLHAQHLGQIINSTGDLQTRIQQWVQLNPDEAGPNADQPGATEGTRNAARPSLSTEYAPATNEQEQLILDVWQQVLGIAEIGIHDNFFELGGHSLIGTQVISRLRHAFQVNLPLTILFEAPTPAELALSIQFILLEEIEKLDDEEVARLVG